MQEFNSLFIEGDPPLFVEHAGSGDLLLLLHGLVGSSRDWRLNIPGLSEFFLTVAADLRGCGASGDFDGMYRLTEAHADIDRIMAHFGARRLFLTGVQAGARLAMDYAIARQDRVAGLVLGSTNSGAEHIDAVQTERIEREIADPIEAGVPVIQVMGESLIDSQLAPKAHPLAGPILRESLERARNAPALAILQTQLGWDQSAQLGDIRAPTLVIAGADDRLVPVAAARAVHEGIPGSRFAILAGAAHNVHVEQPEHFNALTLAFLREVAMQSTL